jgi:small subunit ribosomal protein S8
MISDALSIIKNAENVGKAECLVPNTKLVKAILQVLQKTGYIGQFKDGIRTIRVELVGKINALHAIRPRFSVGRDEFEKFEKRYLPSRDIGIIIVSTSQGVMTHKEIVEKGIGGRLLAYVY